MSKTKTVIIIPARLQSIRLPKKPLMLIDGVPMIIRVYEQALKTDLGKVIVAGCDTELATLVKSYGYNYVHTDPELQSGTDRVFHGYRNMGEKYDNIINLQGDMPYINPETIIAVNNILNDKNNSEIDIATAVTYINNLELVNNKNTVKVILTHQNIALYFTRSSIRLNKNYKHIGIYGFRYNSLDKFVSLPQSNLEKDEKLEQLRALENGMKIKAVITKDRNISIDTKSDLLKCM